MERDDAEAQVARFARSLGHAVTDAVAARANGCIVYCDSDVALGLIFGADAAMHSGELDLQQWLAYALIAGGFMGPVAILRPHLVELDHAIPTLAARSAAGGDWWVRMAQFLETEGLRDAVEALLLFRTRIGRGDEEALDGAVDFLRSAGWRGVLALELVRGEWRQRLKQLSQHVLKLGSADTKIGSDLRDAMTWQAFSCFERLRPHFGRNNLIDALAVSALARENGRATPRAAIRFFTGSRTFERVVHSRPDIRGALLDNAEDLLDAASPSHASLILRDSHYVLVRASFRALGIGALEKGTEEPTLAELLEIARELRTLESRGAKVLALAARTLTIGGRQLLDVINEIESLAFVSNVLIKQGVPAALRAWLLEKGDSLDSLETSEAVNTVLGIRLRRSLAAFRQTVGEQQEVLRSWGRLVDVVYRGARARVRTFAGVQSIDFDRDLGVVRWGGIGDSDPAAEAELLLQLAGHRRRESARAAEELILRGVRDGNGSVSLAAVAWSLGAFDAVVAILNRLQDSNRLSLGLNIMRTAARLRSDVLVSKQEMTEHIEALDKLLRQDASLPRTRLLLGLGYCAYYAARKWGSPNGSRSWLSVSMSFGRESFACANGDDLSQAFAINHCVFVAAQMGTPDEEWLARLRALETNRAIWNYRFSDTLAWRRFYRARSSMAVDAVAARVEAREALAELEGLGPTFGDLEIVGHVEELRQWLEVV